MTTKYDKNAQNDTVNHENHENTTKHTITVVGYKRPAGSHTLFVFFGNSVTSVAMKTATFAKRTTATQAESTTQFM